MTRALRALATVLLLAGCAGAPADDPTPAATPTPVSVPAPATTPSAAAPVPSTASATPTFTPGVVYERAFDYAGNTAEVRDNFTVHPEARVIRFTITTGGKPADGSFQNALMDVYAPGFTSPLFAELPGQEDAKTYTRDQTGGGPWAGKWMARYAGQGKTSVTLRVAVE